MEGNISQVNDTLTGSVNFVTGLTPDINVGQTETLNPNEEAYVELDESSTKLNPVLNFGIPKGETGPQGIQGIQGIQGPKGDKGDKGDTGEQGLKGDKGDKGEQGLKGDKGDKGDTGSTGSQGPKGDTGASGNDGFSPTATVSKVGNVATIEITDKNGTTTVEIRDGKDGTTTNLLQDFDVTRLSTTNALSEAGTMDFSDKFVSQFIAPLYDNTTTYDEGNFVTYNHQIYYCLTHIGTPENFDPNKWVVFPYTVYQFMYSTLTDMKVNNIGTLEELTTTDYSNLVNAINEVNGHLKYLAPEYDNTDTYNAMEVVLYGNKIYMCTIPVTTPEDFDTNKWQELSSAYIYTFLISQVEPAIAKVDEVGRVVGRIMDSIAPYYDDDSTYNVGDYVTYQGVLYVCNTTISTAESFTPAHWTSTNVMSVLGNVNSVLSSLTTPSNNGGGN